MNADDGMDYQPGTWRLGHIVDGRYEVRDIVRGGMGLVYRVRHREWEVDLALKVPRPDLLRSQEFARRFEMEAESWVELGLHPHTVSCVYVRRLAGRPGVFAEWVEGGTLRDAIRGRRIYGGEPGEAIGRLVDVAVQIAWGLDHAHRSGLIHQDVKPANVMLTRDGTAKVTDFGLAGARADEQSLPAGTTVATYAGMTPEYCSPEQEAASADRGIKLGRATDTWSWAVSVLDMFTGVPHTQPGPAAPMTLSRLVANGPENPWVPGIPRELAAILQECLHADPASRPSDLSALADSLAGLYETLTSAPYVRPRPNPASMRADGLSNRAVSMLDLGRPDRAAQLWAEALGTERHHPHATYNRGMHQWRAGVITDSELVSELEQVRGTHPRSAEVEQLLGFVHLERGDAEAAARLLEPAVRQRPADAAVTWAYQAALELSRPSPPATNRGQEREVVHAVTVTPDGRYAVAGTGVRQIPRPPGEKSAVHVWDLRTGQLMFSTLGEPLKFQAVGISADGRVVAAGGDQFDPTIWVWDVLSGTLLSRFTWHTNVDRDRLSAGIEAVALSPDGRHAASASNDGGMAVWQTDTGELVRTLIPGGSGGGYGSRVTFDESGQRLICWEGGTRRLRVWDTGTWEPARTIEFGGGSHARLSGDGRFALVDDQFARLEVWRPATGERVSSCRRHDQWATDAFAVSGDGRLALSHRHGVVTVWEPATGRCLRSLSGHDGIVSAVALSADSRVGISGSLAGTVRVWDLPPAGPRSPASYVRHRSADELSERAAAVSVLVDRAHELIRARRWAEAAEAVRAARAVPGYRRDRRLLELWTSLGHHGWPTELTGARLAHELPGDMWAISGDGRVAVARTPGTFQAMAWATSSGRRIGSLDGHRGSISGLVCTPDGRLGATGCGDGQVRVFELATCTQRHRLCQPSQVHDVTISDDGQLVVSTDYWRMWTWRLRHGLPLMLAWRDAVELGPGDGLAIKQTVLSADAGTVLAATDGGVWVWETSHGRLRHVFEGSSEIALSVDGRTALLSGRGGQLLVCDPVSAHVHRSLDNVEPSTALAISADGRYGHVGAASGSIRVWDLTAGQLLHTLTGHTSRVTQLVCLSGGRFVVSASHDGTARLWDPRAGRALRVLGEPAGSPAWVTASDRGGTVLVSRYQDDHAEIWELDWDYTFHAPTD
jgi:WD40 repeat protein/serine/threonine protein kinase